MFRKRRFLDVDCLLVKICTLLAMWFSYRPGCVVVVARWLLMVAAAGCDCLLCVGGASPYNAASWDVIEALFLGFGLEARALLHEGVAVVEAVVGRGRDGSWVGGFTNSTGVEVIVGDGCGGVVP